jgi:hypothetical protein
MLTVDLAIADVAYFIQYAKKHKLEGIDENTPWIVVGASYTGA